MPEGSTLLDLPFHDLESKDPSSQSLLRLDVYFLFLPFLHCSVTGQNEEVVAQSVNRGKSNEQRKRGGCPSSTPAVSAETYRSCNRI